jgi:hypothetical protein
MKKLKLCPFCGSVAELDQAIGENYFIIDCTNGNCGARITGEHAVDAWNNRISEKAPEWLSQALDQGDDVHRP